MADILEEFRSICNIPRPSFHEEKIADYLLDWASKKGIYATKDMFNNVYMRIDASNGYENYESLCLQAHTDMVCEKSLDFDHNFHKDAIKFYIDGDIVSTRGKTTLGADDGLGVASILSIFSDKDIKHPELEAIFTSAEEEDFSGAKNFPISNLKSRYLINLDHCDESQIVCGSCGGTAITISKSYKKIKRDNRYKTYSIGIRGLLGGHSGEDIDKGRGNSILLLSRLMRHLKGVEFYVGDIRGGNFRLAIPRDSFVKIEILESEYDKLLQKIDEFDNYLKKEYSDIKGIEVKLQREESFSEFVMPKEAVEELIDLIIMLPHDVQIINGQFNTVDASCNLGELYLEDEKIKMVTEIRARLNSQLDYILSKYIICCQRLGFDYNIWGEYPGWNYVEDSKLRKLALEIYEKDADLKPEVLTIHAGLEPAFFVRNRNDLDIISIGPNAWNFHSPDEAFSLSSYYRFHSRLIEIIENSKFIK